MAKKSTKKEVVVEEAPVEEAPVEEAPVEEPKEELGKDEEYVYRLGMTFIRNTKEGGMRRVS
jgi:hypothetical protein